MNDTETYHTAKFSAIILAGGKSRRMNYPKPFLPFNHYHNFLEKIVSLYFKSGCSRIVTAINQRFREKYPGEIIKAGNFSSIINIPDPSMGRTFSLKSALKAINDANPVFIHNVDSPFVKGHTIKTLCGALPDEGYVSPLYKGQSGHPIIISNSLQRKIMEAGNDQPLRSILKGEKRKNIKVSDAAVLENINTIEKYFESMDPEYTELIKEKGVYAGS